MRPFAAWLRRVLADHRIISWACAWAAIVSFQVLFQGWAADDHALRGLSLGVARWAAWKAPVLRLFTFYDGDPARTGALVDQGFSPWWTDPHLSIALFRPLTSLTHWVDFRVDSPAFAHAQNLAFYLGVVAVAAALYRRLLGRTWVAGFAAVIFAADHNHAVPVSWVSNRNALVAGLFGLLALVAHERAHREGRPSLALASALALALGLGGGEVALGAVAYLGAYALTLDDRPVRARVASLGPHVVVLAAWLVVYRAGRFGAHGSGLYVDPSDSPRAFLVAAAENLPLLLESELGGFAPDFLAFLPRFLVPFLVFATLAVAVAFVAFAPLRSDRRARFFFLGALLATVPSAATFPSGRLMLLPSFGLLGLAAMVVEGVVDGVRTWRPGPSRWAAVATAAWTGGAHLVLSPLSMQLGLVQIPLLERTVARYGEGLGDAPELARQRVVLVNPPDVFFTYYMVSQRITAARVAPASLLALASGKRTLEIERPDASTLVVRPEGGFFGEGTEILTRRPDLPMPAGSRVALTGVTIDVTRADDRGVPTEAAFHFDGGLEDAHLRWLAWRGKALVPFELPALGERRRIAAQVPSM